MYHRSLHDIIVQAGRAIGELTREMQGEDELFASALTLDAVEAQLLVMARTLGNLTPALHRRLPLVDWNGWRVLHDKLRLGVTPRREETWYAVSAMVPQTIDLMEDLRRRQPVWFEIGY